MGSWTRKEKFYRWLAWKLPRDLIYWCTIRLFAHATTVGKGKTQTPDEVTIWQALERWEQK